MIIIKKRCSKCHSTKPLDHFYRSKFGKHGRKSICKRCISYQKSNPGRVVYPYPDLHPVLRSYLSHPA